MNGLLNFWALFLSFFFLISLTLTRESHACKELQVNSTYLPWIIRCNSTSNITQHLSRWCAAVRKHSQWYNGCDSSLLLCITTVRNIVAVEQRVDSLKLNKTLEFVSYISSMLCNNKHKNSYSNRKIESKVTTRADDMQFEWASSALRHYSNLAGSFSTPHNAKRELLNLEIQITEIKKIHICWVWILVYTTWGLSSAVAQLRDEKMCYNKQNKPRLCRVRAPSGMEVSKVSVSGEKWMVRFEWVLCEKYL